MREHLGRTAGSKKWTQAPCDYLTSLHRRKQAQRLWKSKINFYPDSLSSLPPIHSIFVDFLECAYVPGMWHYDQQL